MVEIWETIVQNERDHDSREKLTPAGHKVGAGSPIEPAPLPRRAHEDPWKRFRTGELVPLYGWWWRVAGADYDQGALVLTPVEPSAASRRRLRSVKR